MTFLHLALLGGTALGAAPIIIHLLLRRRHKVVRWGAMKYLLEAIEENRKRIQLEDMILLALRVLALVLLALALARPFMKGDSVAPGARLAVIVVDNSPSMQAKRGGASRWELGRAWAGALIDRLPRGSAVALLPMAGSGGGSPGLGQPTRERAIARKVLGELRVSARRADPAGALKAANRVVGEATDLATRTVYVISDFQANDWSAENPALRRALADLAKAGSGTSLVAVQCSSGETRNNCVTSLSRAGRIIKVESPARIAAGLTRRSAAVETGDGAGSELGATLEVDGLRVDSRSARLGPDQTREAVFYASFGSAGDHAVVLRSAPDASPADDVRYLAVEAREEVRVLVVDGDPRPREDFLSESFYLRFALRPGQRALSPIAAKVIEPEAFAGEEPRNYDLVILANLDRMESNKAGQLADYVRSGGALLVFLGDRVDAAGYNSTLFGGPDALARVRLGEEIRAGRGEELQVAAGELSGELMGFFKGDAGGLTTARFGRAMEIDLTAAPECKVQAQLVPGGRPLLVSADVGEGRLAIVNTSADVAWSNLPLKPAFTAVVQRLVVWLLEPASRCQNLAPGERYRLVLPLAALNRTLTFRTPSGRTFTRAPVADARTRLAVVEFDATEEAGFYEVSWEGLEGGKERRLFAVNVDAAESDLKSIEAAVLRELAGGAEARWVDATDPRGEETRGGGREFWRALLLAALAVVCLETYLNRRFSGGGW